MSRLVLSLLSLAAVHGFAPAKTPFALGRAGVRYAGVGDDEIYAAASACLDEECSVDTVDVLLAALRTREQELAKPGRVVDYEHMETLTDVRMMISDLEGLSDPNPFNPFILAIKSAFDVKRKGLYAASPTAEEDYAASR